MSSPLPSLPPRHKDWVVVPRGLVNGVSKGVMMQNGSVVTSGFDSAHTSNGHHYVSMSPVNRRRENPALSRSNGPAYLVSRGPHDDEISSAPAAVHLSPSSSPSPTPHTNHSVQSDSATVSPRPRSAPGKLSCPRCARKFQHTDQFQQHKERCLS